MVDVIIPPGFSPGASTYRSSRHLDMNTTWPGLSRGLGTSVSGDGVSCVVQVADMVLSVWCVD